MCEQVVEQQPDTSSSLILLGSSSTPQDDCGHADKNAEGSANEPTSAVEPSPPSAPGAASRDGVTLTLVVRQERQPRQAYLGAQQTKPKFPSEAQHKMLNRKLRPKLTFTLSELLM